MGISTFWNVFFIAALSQAVFVILVLFGKYYKNGQSSSLILGLFISSFSALLLNYLFFWNGLMTDYPHTLFSIVSIRFVLAPLFFLYCLTFIRIKFKLESKDVWHFMIFIIVTLVYLPILLKSGADKLAIVQPPYIKKYLPYFYLGEMLRWLFPIQLIGYSTFLFVILRKFKNEKINSLPEKKVRQYIWLILLNGLFLVYGLLMLIYHILVNYEIGGLEKDFIISAFMCVAIYGISYIGMMNPELMENAPFLEKISRFKYANSSLKEKQANEIIEQLENLMHHQTMYLEPNLNLQQVAGALNISRHLISESLNMIHKKSFHNYINEYRINYAINLLKSENKENNIKTVLYSSGFNNRASFNNNFKKITGKTASEFIKALGER